MHQRLLTALSISISKMSSVKEIAKTKVFGGFNRRFQHPSTVCGCDMKFHIFFPPQAETSKVPVLFYLSGLTCTDENFITKAGAQRAAAQQGIALVAPDTSPRGLGVPGSTDDWEVGEGAGFYLNATVEKWKNWRMDDYITKELPALLKAEFSNLDVANAGITGHSMGGHGALTVALRNPTMFKSVFIRGAFASALSAYLGDDESKWEEYDAVKLMKAYKGQHLPLLVDVGSEDKFMESDIMPSELEQACKESGHPIELRIQDGYDHGYFMVATFVDDHVSFHAKNLTGAGQS